MIIYTGTYIPKGESTTYIAFEFNPYIDIDLIEIKGALDYLKTEKEIANSQNFIGMYPMATKIYQIYFEARPGQIANIEIEFPEEDNDINNFDILNIYEYSTYARKVYNNKQNFLLNKKKKDSKIILESYYVYYGSTKYIALEFKLSHDIISNLHTSFSANFDSNSNEKLKLIRSYDYILDYGETAKISHISPYNITYFCLPARNTVNIKMTINSYSFPSDKEEILAYYIQIYVYECNDKSQSYCYKGKEIINLDEIFSEDKLSFSYELSYSVQYSSTKYLFFEVQSGFDFYDFEFHVNGISTLLLVIIIIVPIIIIMIAIFFVYRYCRKKNSSKTNSNQILSDIKEMPL